MNKFNLNITPTMERESNNFLGILDVLPNSELGQSEYPGPTHFHTSIAMKDVHSHHQFSQNL